ncbi:polysaccharide pyruvyl transferase family protein [Nocardioides sp. URHA0020]|uniref:polysaccharide pyruvyl transferase family protein n=1 Tax=Nocardioides sp. URHA0020 TaxID=1380392 RepID=UPI000688932E|nr:polysaccharide pyruvyl transferase family protein [Nocardioides sp. URHA0020]
MTNVFVRSYLSATQHPDARRVFDENLIGNNLGNLLYAYAAERQLSASGNTIIARATRGKALQPEWMQAKADHLVIPLANAFRWSFLKRLDGLSELIEGLDIPVTVLGVGAQAGVDGAIKHEHGDEVDASVKRFVAAVLERGPSIGVRGEFTRDYLVSLGFPDAAVDVIGCPSLFLRGDDLTLHPLPDLTPESRIALNLSPYVAEMGPVIQHNAERYPRLDYVAQDIDTLGMLLGEEYTGSRRNDPLLPTGPQHPLIQGGRTWMAVNPPTWMEELGRYDFSFGTRIHGNIAALLGGTPAFVLAHDSRTLELARYHEIPHLDLRSVDGAVVDAATIAAEADYGPATANHAERFRRYVAYLDRHHLKHVFAPGESGADFDAAVAATSYPPVVRAGQPLPPAPAAESPSAWRRLRSKVGASLRR